MSFGKVDLGLAMAMAAAETSLADATRFVGWYLAAEAGGRVAAIRPVAIADSAADQGEPVSSGLLWQEYRPGPGGTWQLSGRARTMQDEVALAGLREALRASPEAVLVVATRLGATSFEFEGRGMRRSTLTPDQAAAVFAPLPAPRLPRQLATAIAPGELTAVPAAAESPSVAPPTSTAHTEVVAPALPQDIEAILEPARAGPLLAAIGLLAPGGQLRRDERRKHGQIVHLISQVADVLRGLPRDRELTIVDAGCGKSQLLFVLNHVLTEGLGLRAQLFGLDVSPQAIATAQELQRKLGYANMAFRVAAIREWRPPARLDVVLSLHACDTATDEAIALGLAAGAAAIVAVPCCQAELARQAGGGLLGPALAHGVLRRRFGDWATDALRALYMEAQGYGVDVLEYVSPLDTPKNIMLRARRGAGTPAAAAAARVAFERICAEFGLDPSLPRLHRALAVELAGKR